MESNPMTYRVAIAPKEDEPTRAPLVSVIALCFSHAKFVVECLESIRAQTYKSVQLIIMDDCSTDNSATIIEQWISTTNTSCEFVKHAVNRGICATLNEALTLASGKYVSMVATDDVWMPDKLMRHVAEMEALPKEVAVLYGDAYQIDEAGTQLPELFIEWHKKKVPTETRIFGALLQGNFIPAMTPLIRRSMLVEAGPYDERLCYEDFDMWLRLSQRAQFVFSDYVSAKYRIVNNSVTRTVLWAKSVPRYRSEFLIYAKCVKVPNISAEERDWIFCRMRDAAENLRRMRDPAATRYIWSLFTHKPRGETFKMLIQAIFLRSPAVEKRVDRIVNLATYLARRVGSRPKT
jgi:glycosyltransferase involved in cell wall biosynthesis